MFSFNVPDDSVIRPLSDDDQRVLLGLVHKYGLSSLMCSLTGLGESSRASTVSANTFLSGTSAPSLVWTASDGASIRTQSTRGDGGVDVNPAIHDPDVGRVSADGTWLESPCAIQSPNQAQDGLTPTSPRLPIPTLKKYQCPMCFLDRNLVEFGRKSDFKKHLNNFHGQDVVWICRTKGCHLSFATERAYSTHAKEAHKMEALPSSQAKTDLCPQVVFSCGFGKCKDRIFEASNKEDAASSRDKYFEHIAKHFEDDFDVNEWEYRVQIQNLMRQQRVKSIWKTCIWPKERRQQLSWKPRSSGDLKRMLECRHLGDDISNLVRLAYILGTAPFTVSRTPPPSEIDLHFQLPFRSQCLLETEEPSAVKSEESKSRPQSMFRLPSRKGRRTRPSTPINTADIPMSDDPTNGPHPGTPMPIPHENHLPADAPSFAPDNVPALPRQMNTPVDAVDEAPLSPSVCSIPVQHPPPLPQQHQQQQQQHHHHQEEPNYSWCPPSTSHSMVDSMVMSPFEAAMPIPSHDNSADYGDMMYGCTPVSQASTARPATPVPHKRPASWGRVTSMEEMRPKKKYSTPNGSTYGSDGPGSIHSDRMSMVSIDSIPNAYGEMIPPMPQQHHYHQQGPTSVPPEWQLPMRMGHETQGGYEAHHHHHQQQHYHQQTYAPAPQDTGMTPMTFFFDDNDGRM